MLGCASNGLRQERITLRELSDTALPCPWGSVRKGRRAGATTSRSQPTRRSGAPPVRAYYRRVVELRSMTIDDVALLVRWDDDPDVAAAIGGRGADWYDWPAELIRDVPWRELLIAEDDGRPIGFRATHRRPRGGVALLGGHRTVDVGARHLDRIVRRSRSRARCGGDEGGTGARLRPARRRDGGDRSCRRQPSGDRVHEQLGFERVGVREFGDDECLVMRLLRGSTD